LKYSDIYEGVFISRPNRFIAKVEVNGSVETVHVKNTGRCKELLLEGAKVYLQHHDSPSRKTNWSLIAVKKDERIVNIDSQIPNRLVFEWLKEEKLLKNIVKISPEFTYGGSRLDFYVETESEKVLIEVKGVTLEEEGVALFPDAPTERGVKHILELCRSVEEGYKAYIIFVIQMESVRYFAPNSIMHKEFANALSFAKSKNVNILALDCHVEKDSISIGNKVKVAV